jgi:beta-glucosidase
VLPLGKGKSIAVYGVASYNTYIGGTGSGEVSTTYSVSIADGLNNAGYKLPEDLKTIYSGYIEKDKAEHPKKTKVTLGAPRMVPEMEVSKEIIEKSAAETDFAIFTIGRNAGEGADRKVDGDFNLTETEQMLLKNVADAFHAKGKKLIILINAGGVIETASWKNNADAILLTWQAGMEAGNAIADVVSGTVNPSGKLATTFPVKYEDVPSSKNFPGTPVDRPKDVVYEEGVYVGYRYYNSFDVKTSYPFGYGLSYTSFSYSNLKLSSSTFKGSVQATVTVTNTGKVEGKEVVQLYLCAPAKSMDKPAMELKGFAKTNLLKPDASQSITFTLNAKDLASFNTAQSAWIADSGEYTVKIGASSEDIKLTKDFKLTKDILVEKTHKALVPQVLINELKRK